MQKASSHPVRSEVGAVAGGTMRRRIEALPEVCGTDRETPNSKHQTPKKLQAPNLNIPTARLEKQNAPERIEVYACDTQAGSIGCRMDRAPTHCRHMVSGTISLP